MNTVYKTIKSPIGDLTLIADQKYLLAVLWKIGFAGGLKCKDFLLCLEQR